MNTVITLSHSDMIDFVTGGGQQTVAEVGGEQVIENEIDRYTTALAVALGDGFEVEVSNYAIETQIDGLPARYSDHAEAVADAEASVVNTFW